MRNSFTPPQPSYMPRPQVCHPPPPPPPPPPPNPPGVVAHVRVDWDIDDIRVIVNFALVGPYSEDDVSLPGTVATSGTSATGQPYVMVATIRAAPAQSTIDIEVEVDEEGTPAVYQYTCEAGVWDGTAQWTGGAQPWSPEPLNGVSGKITIGPE